MEFQLHNDFLFSVAIPELQELQSWKEILIKEYKQNIIHAPHSNDLSLKSFNEKFKGFRNFVLPLIHQKVQKYFIIEESWGYDTDRLNIYIQENIDFQSAHHYFKSKQNFHNHITVNGINLAGVFYLSLPNVGGEFETMHLPHWESHIIKPEINRFYFFPSWLYHRPLPQQDKEPRICINWGLIGEKRPILKKFSRVW